MSDVLFYIFAALTLLCGFLVVLNPFKRPPEEAVRRERAAQQPASGWLWERSWLPVFCA